MKHTSCLHEQSIAVAVQTGSWTDALTNASQRLRFLSGDGSDCRLDAFAGRC